MESREHNERQLIDRLVSGDAEAFREIYDSYQGRVFSFAFHLTKSKDTAEEIVQEVFIKLWERRAQVDPVKNFGQYIRTITHNNVIDFYRRVKKERSLFETFYQNLVDQRNTPTDPMLEKELSKAYTEAVNRLAPHQKIVYLLRRDEDLSYQHIAERLGISIHTVRNQLSDANKSIRAHIRRNPDITLLLLISWIEYMQS